jgi:hypothetical protein
MKLMTFSYGNRVAHDVAYGKLCIFELERLLPNTTSFSVT